MYFDSMYTEVLQIDMAKILATYTQTWLNHFEMTTPAHTHVYIQGFYVRRAINALSEKLEDL